jgi:hypothetical protein
MGKITLGGAMPPDNNDGLAPHSQTFLDDYKPGNPLVIYNVVCRISVDKITTKTVDGLTYPTLKIEHWELVPAELQETFGEIIGKAYGDRTGFVEPDQLPFADGTKALNDPFPEEDDPPADPDAVPDLDAHKTRRRAS